jgi:hypothetical protein
LRLADSRGAGRVEEEEKQVDGCGLSDEGVQETARSLPSLLNTAKVGFRGITQNSPVGVHNTVKDEVTPSSWHASGMFVHVIIKGSCA